MNALATTPGTLAGVSSRVLETERWQSAAILATVVYHDLLGLPLTLVHIWRYLIRPRAGVTERAMRVDRPTLREIEEDMTQLVADGPLEARYGFFFLRGRSILVDRWLQSHVRGQRKWKRLQRLAFWLQGMPFLRGVAVTGSLAFENTKETSDLDVLVIAAPNRVWTARFFLTLFLDLFRLRRRPSGPTADRVCLNHYLAADVLAFPYRSLYTAMEYARLVPLIGEETCRAFRAANRGWMEEYLVQVFPDTLTHRKTIRASPLLLGFQRMLEAVIAGMTGHALERILARFQRRRIARAEPTAAPHGRVVATDAHAEFHPHSREAPLLGVFNQRMERLGLAEWFGNQRDSGLTR